MRKLEVDESFFLDAFERDPNFVDLSPECYYLDTETGEIIWLFEDDEEAASFADITPEQNREIRERVEASPKRHLEIPGMSHSEHHAILQRFLESDWTDDEEAKEKARRVYNRSIGDWKMSADSNAESAYLAYRYEVAKKEAEDFLREHGIEPIWK